MNHGLIDVETALRLVSERIATLDAESVPLSRAPGRVLRREVLADMDSPPFDASAMDGYAICLPASADGFRCVGEIAAGDEAQFSLNPGECVRIYTGARVPAQASQVVMQENTARAGDLVRVLKTSAPSYIRQRGENARTGDVIVPVGTILSAIDLAAMASCGVTEPVVTRRARVLHIVTGDELIPPDQCPTGTQIRDSNSILVSAFIESVGAELIRQIRVGDDLAAARTLLDETPDFDLLLISGGASVGAHDFAKPLLREASFDLIFEKINLRPGKPLVFAARDRQLAFAIPGNPVSHWVVLELIIGAAIRKLQGDTSAPRFRHGKLERDFSFRADARRTFWPCAAHFADDGYRLVPLRFISSGDVGGLAGANALLSIPPGESFISSHDQIEFLLCQHGR